MAHHWIMEHGLLSEDGKSFSWRGVDMDVVVEKETKRFKERESLGGGWYGSSTETVTAVVERRFAYHNGFLVGEIIDSATFQNPLRRHIIISRTKD